MCETSSRSISGSAIFGLPQEAPAALRLHPFEALPAEQQLAHFVEDESRFGVTATLTRIVRELPVNPFSGAS
jgi:hypothetical protein